MVNNVSIAGSHHTSPFPISPIWSDRYGVIRSSLLNTEESAFSVCTYSIR